MKLILYLAHIRSDPLAEIQLFLSVFKPITWLFKYTSLQNEVKKKKKHKQKSSTYSRRPEIVDQMSLLAFLTFRQSIKTQMSKNSWKELSTIGGKKRCHGTS